MTAQVTRPKMTAKEATSFDGYSVANSMILNQAARDRGCTCEPYTDWFTYNRWQAQGFQVQRGEKSTKVTTMISVTDKQSGEIVGKFPRAASVFCRCQVQPTTEE